MGTSGEADIGSWRKIVELGSGRTGSVALCIEPISSSAPNEERSCGEHQHHVFQAVKRVRRQCVKNNGAIRQVLQEKKALQDLRGHQGIVDLRYTSKDDEHLYFVLEPLLGGPLHRHIRAGPRGHLEVPAAIFYASEITSAIAHMHSHGFVHRDLKASNIVFSASGHVKIVDLGCSKQLERQTGGCKDGDVGATGGFSFQKTYTYCGTPHSMAPEMVSREGHGMAVDWWALGILVHEMVNGEPPFGYGGDYLTQRITAGLPRDTFPESGERADKDYRNVDEPKVLPIVRRLLDTDPQQRLGFSRDAQEVMSHAWFADVDWERTTKLETEPPAFRKDLGELEHLDAEHTGISATDVDPDGLFAGF
ncbi:unnamed protein product [Ectocarpus sp. 6 AP-2014]